jgi:Leucine-rich repeat (LRR) protein
MYAGDRAEPKRASRRPRWLFALALGILGAAMTLAVPLLELFRGPYRLSDDVVREITEIRELGGERQFLERTPGLFGLFGRRDLIGISIRGKPLSDEALARLVKNYGDHLSALELTNTGITDAGLRHLAGLTHLPDLSLRNNDHRPAPPGAAPSPNTITDAGLVHLKGLTTLRTLNLGGLPVTDAGLDAIKDLPNLEQLYLDRTEVIGCGLGRLKSLPRLTALYLDRSAVTDEGLDHLKGAVNLEVLSLSGVPLTPRGLASLKTLPKLKRLDITRCGLLFEDLDAFQVAHPAIKLK